MKPLVNEMQRWLAAQIDEPQNVYKLAEAKWPLQKKQVPQAVWDGTVVWARANRIDGTITGYTVIVALNEPQYSDGLFFLFEEEHINIGAGHVGRSHCWIPDGEDSPQDGELLPVFNNNGDKVADLIAVAEHDGYTVMRQPVIFPSAGSASAGDGRGDWGSHPKGFGEVGHTGPGRRAFLHSSPYPSAEYLRGKLG